MTIVACHQPTFLPWLGWWDKLQRADLLVVLDDVQFPNSGRTWMNRVRILVDGTPTWLTIPVHKDHSGPTRVRETFADDTKPWRDRACSKLAEGYAAAPHFGSVFPEIEGLLRSPTSCLSDLNEQGIRVLAAGLGLNVGKLVRQSELDYSGKGTDMLISVCRAVGATTYLTGDGAGGYLESGKFAAAGLDLIEQRFVPPSYSQLSDEFVPGLSVVDALMNSGWSGTRALLER
jgi:hypothetical protein